MRKGIFAAAALSVGFAFAVPAAAVNNTSTQTIPLTSLGGGKYTASFTKQPGSGTFLDTFLFELPRAGRVTISLFSEETGGPTTNVNFITNRVLFNGENLATLSRGVIELRELVSKAVTGGTSTLTVQGAAGSAGTYTGLLSYAIPEPAMWALMILGFGFTGAALRTRRRSVTFANA